MVRRICRGLWPVGPSGRGAVSGLRPDEIGGVPIAYADAGGGGVRLVGEVGCLAFEVGRQVQEPQHFNGVANFMALGCGLPSSVRRVGGGVHVADDDGGGEHGHVAICFGQGLDEEFCGVAEGDVGVDDVELPSVPDILVDSVSLGCQGGGRGGRGCRLGHIGESLCASSICRLSGPGYIWGWVLEGRPVVGLVPGR